MELADRVVVVTGAGGGIGRATALAFSERGCRIAAVDVDEAGLDSLARELAQSGTACSVHRCDVADAEAMEVLPDAVIAAHGAVHVVVNNAGVTLVGPLDQASREDLEWIVGVNLWGVIWGCRFFLPHLLAADRGHLVNVSSTFGLAGMPMQAAYCATKYAVRGFTEALWEELDDTTVGVTLVHPASFDTGIVEGSRGATGIVRERLEQVQRRGHPPQVAGRAIVDAVERGRRRVLLGPAAYGMDWIKRFAPLAGNRLITRAAVRMLDLDASDLRG